MRGGREQLDLSGRGSVLSQPRAEDPAAILPVVKELVEEIAVAPDRDAERVGDESSGAWPGKPADTRADIRLQQRLNRRVDDPDVPLIPLEDDFAE